MAKIAISKIAKELKVTQDQVKEWLTELRIELSGKRNSVDEEAAKKLKEFLESKESKEDLKEPKAAEHKELDEERCLERFDRTYGVLTSQQVMTYLTDHRIYSICAIQCSIDQMVG